MQPNLQGISPLGPPDDDIGVLIVDDQRRFREAIRELIACVHGFALVGEACSGEDGVTAVTTLSPQLVLMDVVMPGMGGIAAARQILRHRPEPVVVLISVDDPSLYPGAASLGGLVRCLRKQDLRPSRLPELWGIARESKLKPASPTLGDERGPEALTLPEWSDKPRTSFDASR